MAEIRLIDVTEENLQVEHLSCIIRTKTAHPGVETKRKWVAERLTEGHVFRKADIGTRDTVFIEYAPLEKAWVPVIGDNYLYIYCLWVAGMAVKGKGYGKALMESCIADARAAGKSGICMLGAKKQKAWLSDASFARKYGFTTVDETENGYELLALSFDGSVPRFTESAKRMEIEGKELTIYYSDQCPFIPQRLESIRRYCTENGVPYSFIHVDTLEKAKTLPCVFNNWAVFVNGRFETVNQIAEAHVKKLTGR